MVSEIIFHLILKLFSCQGVFGVHHENHGETFDHISSTPCISGLPSTTDKLAKVGKVTVWPTSTLLAAPALSPSADTFAFVFLPGRLLLIL